MQDQRPEETSTPLQANEQALADAPSFPSPSEAAPEALAANGAEEEPAAPNQLMPAALSETHANHRDGWMARSFLDNPEPGTDEGQG